VTVCFISDLHLDAGRPEATDAFIRFLRGPALKLERLYILGDLFEYWIGDDDPNPHNRMVTQALQTYTQQQPRSYFMPGNRDFMIGLDFMRETGLQPLDDPCIVDVHGTPVLISHGDIYCTDDTAYQRFRRFSHNPVILMLYRALPFSLRRRLVDKARDESRAQKEHKTAEIMDVNQQAVESSMRDFGVATLLHGHTHRAGEHQFALDGQTATRIVLGDWYDSGPVLYWDARGRRTDILSY